MTAPVITGYLGKQPRQQNISNGNGINNLLGDVLGNQKNRQFFK